MRRRKRPTGISLFAFQDIITSVSGILIVLVLLLAMQLTESGPPPPSAPGHVAGDLRRAIQDTEQHIERLRQRIARDTSAALDGAQHTADELHQEAAELKRTRERLGEESDRLEKRRVELEGETEEVLALEAGQEQRTAEYGQLQELVSRTEQQLRDVRQGRRIICGMPRGIDKEGWLVEIDGTISLAPFGRPQPPQKFGDAGQFLRWSGLASRPYLFLVVQPAGLESFDAIRAKLDERGLRYGFDVAPEGQLILDPDRGAVP